MSHELYYTSAPEGLKRGASGFSTVATTDNLPKPLWDRLETLSAYRHHFGVASEGANSNPTGAANPTAFAHQLLSVTGTTYHVLSRICDAGVDHTQRSNAFAHHLVLDSAEMASAAGGPAWLLQQPGVLETSWNGNVGTISRKHLIPVGTTTGAVCSHWQTLTGDAGWGGALADLFVKSPAKPVCILFSPEQANHLLPLLAETIALLPPQTRWNVTFNTYFTSMPTSATCAWRCCLANTPAAQIGLRYAAGGGGIVIDLTDRARLPELPPGDYVTYARTGIPPASAKPPSPASTASPASSPPPPRLPALQRNASPAVSPLTLSQEAQEERREFELLEAAQRAATSESAPHPSLTPQDSAGGAALRTQHSALTPPRRARKTAPSILAADRAYLLAQTDAAAAAARRRKQIMLLFGSALLALAAAMVIVAIAIHNDAPTDLPSLPRPRVAATPALAPPPSIAPPTPAVPIAPAPAPTTAASNTIIIPAPVAPAPILPVAPSPIPVQVVPQFPPTLTLATQLDPPASPQGLADPLQSLFIPARYFNAGARVASLRLRFPNTPSDAPPIAEYTAQGATAGKLTATPSRSLGLPTLTLSWKDAASSTDILTLSLNASAPTRPTLDLTWKAAALVKHPDAVSLTFWLLQNAAIDLLPQRPSDTPQQLLFKPIPLPNARLTDPAITLTLPSPLPLDADAIAPTGPGLPEGWDASAYTDRPAPDPAHPAPADPAHVIKFHKATPVASQDPLFTVRFTNHFTTLENGFPAASAFAASTLADNEGLLRAIDAQLADAAKISGGRLPDTDSTHMLQKKRADFAAAVDAAKQALDDYNLLQHLTLPLALPDGTRLLAIPLTKDKP